MTSSSAVPEASLSDWGTAEEKAELSVDELSRWSYRVGEIDGLISREVSWAVGSRLTGSAWVTRGGAVVVVVVALVSPAGWPAPPPQAASRSTVAPAASGGTRRWMGPGVIVGRC